MYSLRLEPQPQPSGRVRFADVSGGEVFQGLGLKAPGFELRNSSSLVGVPDKFVATGCHKLGYKMALVLKPRTKILPDPRGLQVDFRGLGV